MSRDDVDVGYNKSIQIDVAQRAGLVVLSLAVQREINFSSSSIRDESVHFHHVRVQRRRPLRVFFKISRPRHWWAGIQCFGN